MTGEKTTRGRSQDRSKVAGDREHEVSYEAKKAGGSLSSVKAAVNTVGNSRAKVEDKLGRSK